MISRVLARAAAVGVAAPFLTLTSALAPVHVHEPELGQTHQHAVAHSHFAPHQPTRHDHDAEGPEIEQGDEHVVWLDSPVLHEPAYHVDPVPAAVPAGLETVHVERHWSVTPFDDAAPVHGPPRVVPPFRGPPALV